MIARTAGGARPGPSPPGPRTRPSRARLRAIRPMPRQAPAPAAGTTLRASWLDDRRALRAKWIVLLVLLLATALLEFPH